MVYSAGKLNAVAAETHNSLVELLAPYLNEKHPIADDEITGFKKELRALQNLLKNQIFEVSHEVDMDVFKDKLIASHTPSAAIEEFEVPLMKNTTLLIQSEAIGIVFGAFSIYLGTPLVIAIPSYLVYLTATCLVWSIMSGYHSRKNIKNLKALHDSMCESISAKYDSEHSRILTNQINQTVGLIRKTFKDQRDELVIRRLEVENIVTQLNQK